MEKQPESFYLSMSLVSTFQICPSQIEMTTDTNISFPDLPGSGIGIDQVLFLHEILFNYYSIE